MAPLLKDISESIEKKNRKPEDKFCKTQNAVKFRKIDSGSR